VAAAKFLSLTLRVLISGTRVRSDPLTYCRTLVRHWGVSTEDQILSSQLHGEALFTARRPELQPLIDHLREVAQGRDDIRVECAGTIAGWWFTETARRGEELIAAGLLMLAGHVDLDELDRWVREGWQRRRGSMIPYGPTG
jgi:hypothetical protein